MKLHISKTLMLGVLMAGLSGLQPANAGFANGDFVTMGEKSLFQMDDAGGFSGAHRAWLTQDALDNALVLAADRSPSAVSIDRENGALTIGLAGRRIATVDSNSAEKANLTPDELAQKWSQSLKSALSDTDLTAKYVATLKKDQLVKSEVALVERTMYAPAGMTFQVKLSSGLSSQTIKAGDIVEGTISQDVSMGHYVIPAGAVVTGKVFEGEANSFSIRFQSITTSSGKVFPISGLVRSEVIVTSQGAHPVCTYVIPSGMANGVPLVAGRIPAGIGIGVVESSAVNLLVFSRQSADSIAVGKVLILELEESTPVAVLMRSRLI